jgi:hypothetical protein
MADPTIIGTRALTLADWAKRTEPGGKIDKIIDILNETNEVLEDMLWMEGNLPTGHRTTIRTGLPSAAWRILYKGVQPSKSTTTQVDDTCGMLEAYAEVDKKLADLNGNAAEFRLSEDRAFIEAMNQEMASTLFYGNPVANPERFLGLSPRFNDTDADNGVNILSGGGNGADNTSIWLIVWGQNTCHGIFPKGSKAGLQHDDRGQVTLTDEVGGLFEGYRTHYQWDCGLTLRDWRHVVRIANIDVSELAVGTGADLVDLMSEAIELVPNVQAGKAAFYMNRKVRTALRKQIRDKSNVNLTLETAAGKTVLSFDGIPVRRCDALSSAEAPVT